MSKTTHDSFGMKELHEGELPSSVGGKKTPSVRVLEKWLFNGEARALDGCKVEPDGECPHASQSWLLTLGLV